MHDDVDQFITCVAGERARHTKRLRMAALIAGLIAVLLYQTQWLVLRPGLAILLAGQAGVACALFLRNVKLSKDLSRSRTDAPEEAPVAAWFAGEEVFLKRLAIFESGCQMLGFVVLGYEFWTITRNLWLALAIGIIYPVAVYLGITRRRNLQAIKQLRAER